MMTRISVACLLALLVPAAATAQDPAPAGSMTPGALSGWLDFGVRGSSIRGDAARYERFRDLGDGLFLDSARLEQQRGNWFLTFTGDHLGRRDQRLIGYASRPGTLDVWAGWDQIPMLFSRTTRTLFVEVAPDELRIPDLIQSQVQGSAALITSMVNQFARPFELASQRDIGFAGFRYMPTTDWTLRLDVRNMWRSGAIPYGGDFGHSSFVELPAPVNHNLLDVDAGAEYARGRALFRAGYTASLFRNDVTQLIFDNPYRLTDIAGTPSAGRLSLPPSSSFVGVNGTVSYALPRRTRVTAFVSMGSLRDAGDPLMAQTINTALSPAPLARDVVDGQAMTRSVNLTFTTRPWTFAGVDVRYRFYDYDNRTPHFDLTQRVSYDNTPSNLASPVDTEPFGIVRQTFDIDLNLRPDFFGINGRVGYSRLMEDRTFRVIGKSTEDVGRVVVDVMNTRWFSLRTKYEHSTKRGTIDDHALDRMTGHGCSPASPNSCLEQPGMRHYDVADRDRDRVTLLGSFTPFSMVGFNASVATGADDYLNSTFGLIDNTHRVYTAGVDVTPSERVGFGVSYAYEHYNARTRSRQANPGVQFFDVTRNWSSDGTDRVHSVIANAEFAIRKLDVRVTYDLNRARALYLYGTGPIPDRTLPEESDVVAGTLPTPTQLPLIRSEATRGTVDLLYPLTRRISLGMSYWYDDYDVADFSLDDQANPTLDRGSVLLLGYVYRPYTAQTVWGRVVVRW